MCTANKTLNKLREDLATDIDSSPIAHNIICIIIYGSSVTVEPMHRKSDVDIHILAKKLDLEDYKVLQNIFKDYTDIDINLHSYEEITANSTLIFQNGNLGIFFMHIIVDGELIYGKNVYKKLLRNVKKEHIDASLVTAIRQLNWRLRKWCVEDEKNQLLFNKTITRIIKDYLLYKEQLAFNNLPKYSDSMIIKKFIKIYYGDLLLPEVTELKKIAKNKQVTINRPVLMVLIQKIIKDINTNS